MERKTTVTFCRICEATCGLRATVEGGRVVALEPDDEHVVSKGYACVKGLHQHRLLHSPDRLMYPERFDGERRARVSWDDALADIGARVKAIVAEHGPDAVAFYLGNPIAFSFLPPIVSAMFLSGLGSRTFFQTGSQDCNNKFAAAERMYGFPFVQPFPDVDATRCLVIVGSNPAVSRASFVQLADPVRRLRAIEKRGGRVFHVNPRRTETARQVGEHVFIRPDTDVFFYLSFLHEVLARDAIAHDRVAKHMKGLGALRDVAAPYPPERTAEITGIPAATLRDIVSAYLAADGAALFSSTGVNQGSHGTLAFWIQESINAITGNLDRRGGTLVGHGFVKDFPRFARKSGQTMRKDVSRVGSLPSVVDSFPAAILADEILTPGKGRIRALFVLAGNPLLSIPNPSGKLERALRDLDLLVSIDVLRNETGDLAHYVLPGTSPLQRADLPFVFQSLMGVQPVPFAQYTDPVVPREAEQRDETRIVMDLIVATGAKPYGSGAMRALIAAALAAEKLPLLGDRLRFEPTALLGLVARAMKLGSLDDLRRTPHGRLLEPHRGGDFLGRRVVTDDGLVDLAPPELVHDAARLARVFEEEKKQKTRLKLVSKREPTSHNSWMHNDEAMVRGRRSTNYVYMHPDDARARGLADGDVAEVRSASGAVEIPVAVTADMMPGAVALPHGWGHQGATGLGIASRTGGANVNLLSADGPSSVDRISGMAQLTGILVDVTRAGGEATS